LFNQTNAATITGDVKANSSGTERWLGCPKLPQAFSPAPGNASIVGHHSYPAGWLSIVQQRCGRRLPCRRIPQIYGHAKKVPAIQRENQGLSAPEGNGDTSIFIVRSHIGAPLWHDWAKPIVFQWNADGSEFIGRTLAASA
jgi:hypothetical protein